jgi:hypothetical protein
MALPVLSARAKIPPAMDENDTSMSVTCQGCGSQLDEGSTFVDVNIEFQGTIPLLVFYHRCPLCKHEWTDAHEPLNRPELEEPA